MLTGELGNAAYTAAVNPAYINAALEFLPPVDLQKLQKRIHLALLLPMTGSLAIGARIAGAAALAVERVNADKTLLLGRVLEYSLVDSGCSAQKGLKAMGELLAGENRISAIIGPGCNSACEVTSHLSAGQRIPQVSWGCDAPSLSNRAEHELVCIVIRLRRVCLLHRSLRKKHSSLVHIMDTNVHGCSSQGQ